MIKNEKTLLDKSSVVLHTFREHSCHLHGFFLLMLLFSQFMKMLTICTKSKPSLFLGPRLKQECPYVGILFFQGSERSQRLYLLYLLHLVFLDSIFCRRNLKSLQSTLKPRYYFLEICKKTIFVEKRVAGLKVVHEQCQKFTEFFFNCGVNYVNSVKNVETLSKSYMPIEFIKAGGQIFVIYWSN